MAASRRRFSLWSAFVLVAGGCAAAWGYSLGALYVPVCSNFALSHPDFRCRQPLLWIYLGLGLLAVGVLLLVAAVVRAIRRRSSTAG